MSDQENEPDYDDGKINAALSAFSWGCFGYTLYKMRNYNKSEPNSIENMVTSSILGYMSYKAQLYEA